MKKLSLKMKVSTSMMDSYLEIKLVYRYFATNKNMIPKMKGVVFINRLGIGTHV